MSPIASPTILVAGRDPVVGGLLKDLWDDHAVFVVADPDCVLDSVVSLRPDVVVIDLEMPGALAVLHEIRASLAARYTPVLTIGAAGEQAVAAWRGGCDAHIARPCDPSALRRVLTRLAGVTLGAAAESC